MKKAQNVSRVIQFLLLSWKWYSQYESTKRKPKYFGARRFELSDFEMIRRVRTYFLVAHLRKVRTARPTEGDIPCINASFYS